MRETQPDISILIKEQFPEFYRENGEVFIAFLEAYYEWLGQHNNVDNLTDSIFELRDIDGTIDEFVIFFKNKYLANFKPNSQTDLRKLVKHAVEIFGTKGTERCIKLLFQLLYNEEINIYYPGNDVFRLSDGKWFQPRYLELTPAEKTSTFLSKQVTGSTSGAKAFVEGLVRKNIDGRIFDVAFISGIRGHFIAGERISVDGDINGCPLISGSVIDITILNGGSNAAIGDVITIVGGSGVGAKARVTNVESATGKVTFTLNDGGSGYRLTSNVFVSEQVFLVNAVSGSFSNLETVTQPIQRVGYVSGTGNLQFGLVRGLYANGSQAANGVIVSTNSTVVIINPISGNFALADNLATTGNVWTGVIANTTNAYATGLFVGYNANNSQIGLDAISNTFYANASISGNAANAHIVGMYTGNNANFQIGAIEDTESLFLYTDFLSGNNTGGVPYMDIRLDGSNANTVGNVYGFHKPVTGFATNINSIIADALIANTFTFGTIKSLTGVNPGQNYNVNPFIQIRDELTIGFDRHNLVCALANATGTFLPGERVSQVVTIPGYDLTITYIANSPFVASEGVTQDTTGAKGTVTTVNSTHITVTSLNGIPFQTGLHVNGATSTAVANVTANTFAGANGTATGKVIQANLFSVTILPQSINTVFDGNNVITGQTTGITAHITSISVDESSAIEGWNANVTGRVVTANSVISGISMIDSGYGYFPDEEVSLEITGNPVIATGTLNVDDFGSGEGYFRNSDGFLDANKYIHDNEYYQVFSYEIQTGIALERYAAMLKDTVHMAGTIFFGKVLKVSVPEIPSIDIESSVTTA